MPWVILRHNVPVYARPPEDMRVLMRLDYDLVRLHNVGDPRAGAPPDWIGVAIDKPDGRVGYVHADLIRDPRDRHACFGEFNGTWLMTRFGHGIVGMGGDERHYACRDLTK